MAQPTAQSIVVDPSLSDPDFIGRIEVKGEKWQTRNSNRRNVNGSPDRNSGRTDLKLTILEMAQPTAQSIVVDPSLSDPDFIGRIEVKGEKWQTRNSNRRNVNGSPDRNSCPTDLKLTILEMA